MNILTITASNNSIGGASRIAMDIHHCLSKRGHNSFVFSGKLQGDETNSRMAEINRPFWTKALSYSMANDIDFFQTDYLLGTPQFKAADIVHCHNLHGWYFNLATLKKMSIIKPVLWTLHDMWAITPHAAHTSSTELRNGIYQISDKNLYPTILWNNDWYLSFRKSMLYKNMPVSLASPSKWLVEKLEKSCLSDKRAYHIPNGIDFDQFRMGSRSELRKKHEFSEDPLILFVGVDAESNTYKGFDDFLWLASAQNTQNYQFVCMGSRVGGIRGGVRHLEASSNKSYIAEILSCADVLVVTSLYENFPLIILEAMACGTSVLTYDVGGCSEAIQGAPNCTAVKFGDKSTLTQSLNKILNCTHTQGDSLRKELRAYAQKKYSLDLMINSYLDVYEDLISNSRKNWS